MTEPEPVRCDHDDYWTLTTWEGWTLTECETCGVSWSAITEGNKGETA